MGIARMESIQRHRAHLHGNDGDRHLQRTFHNFDADGSARLSWSNGSGRLSRLPMAVSCYALDILAWDAFFALAMLFAAPVFAGPGLCRAIRFGMIASGALAFAGLIGLAVGNMMLRNIGIAGYLGVFLVVDGLIFKLFVRSTAVPAPGL